MVRRVGRGWRRVTWLKQAERRATELPAPGPQDDLEVDEYADGGGERGIVA